MKTVLASPVAQPLEQNNKKIKSVLLAAHSTKPSMEMANTKLKVANVFFRPIQSIKINAKMFPGNSATVVHINFT